MQAGCLTLILLVFTPALALAEAEVEIELLIRDRVPPTAPQEWSKRLAEAGFVRPKIRGARGSDELQILNEGSETRPAYHVTGYLIGDGSIVLPPSVRFGARDGARLARWVKNLKENGLSQPAGAFGLSVQRLQKITEDLQQKVKQTTRGSDAASLVDQIGRGLRYPILIDSPAQQALKADGKVRDELKGLSTGTALAAVLRPAGLVLRPRFRDARLEYVVLDGRTEGDNWPIGWAKDKSPGRLVPRLFKKVDTQDVEMSLDDALNQLTERVQLSFLLDHNGLARQRIEPEDLRVTMSAGRTTYSSVIHKLLRQAHLRYELRLDDGGQAFLWITTVKR